MKKSPYAIARVRPSPKLVLLVAIGVGLIILGVGLLRGSVVSRQLSEWAVENPAPLPGFINGVSPVPGSKNQGVSDRICVTFNTRQPPLGPITAFEGFPFNETHLYVDGSEVDPNTGAIYGHPDALTRCWDGHFSGLHLAEVTTYIEISGTLSYQWAFIGR
jgi:hypothetical protein